jgi:predicted transcriptional regulator
MANCTYRFTDADGKERVIEGQAAFKAYLVNGGLQHLLPGTVIAPALSKRQTETPEFKKWFGDSKVVDAQGEPMVVYRGAYDADKDGTFFSSKPQTASAYAAEEGGFVEPVYMRLANPLEVDAKGGTQMSMPYKGMNVGMTYLLKEAKKEGRDGVIVRDVADMVEGIGTTDYYVSLGKKAQVKSAIGNTGAFGEVNDIRFSRAVPKLEPEDVLKPSTIAAAEAAIKKYKQAEPPDPLVPEERAYGENILQDSFEAADRNKPDFDKTLDQLAEGVGGYAKKPSNKKPYRAVTKLAVEQEWKAETMKDLLRGTIAVSTFEDAQAALDAIDGVYKFDRIKNRLMVGLTDPKGKPVEGKPMPTGYQDVLTNVVLADGTIAEIQISTPEMLAAKHLGHEIYAFEREMPEGPVKTEMIELQKLIYGEAFGAYERRAAKALKTRSNSTLSTSSPFSRTSEGLRGLGAGVQAVAVRQSGETVTGTSETSKNMVPGGKDLKSKSMSPSIHESGAIGINVNQDGANKYADKIVDGEKTLETRTSDSLRPFVGQRVAIVRTGQGSAMAIGEVTIGEPIVVSTQKQFDKYRDQTLIPKDSKFDIVPGVVKYMYPMTNPVRYATERAVEAGGAGNPRIARKVVMPTRAAQKNAAASRVEGTSADRFKRTEQLQQAVADLQEGKITQDEYNRMVDQLRPVYPYESVPAVTTPKDARYALATGKGQSPEKAAKYGAPSLTLKTGDWAQLRLDIPSYQLHDAWVVSVHTPKSTNREVQAAYDAGPVVGYESVAALKDVTFGMNQKAAAKIATGSAKGTIATMLGKWSPISKADAKARADAAINDPAWTQVGMDPFRHSYFYDRDSMRPVLSADAVIQVGPLVLAKNVTFGQDTDVTGAPIAFSRKPMGRETPGWIFSRDELGRFRNGAGAKAYRYVADITNLVLDKINAKPVSPELSRALRKMRIEVEKAQNLTVDVAKNLKDLPKQEREMISDVIEGELKAGIRPPKRVLELAASMQSIMSEQTAELVRLGMLSPQAAGRWDGKYLPRFYEQKLGEETKAWAKAVKGLLARKKTMQGIRGSSLKARGMFQNVPVGELDDWTNTGWQVRDDNFDPAIDDTITVWRDYTRTERDDMGEIRDAMFRFVMGYNKSQRDIALGRLYENLASGYGSKREQPGYVQVPATKVEDTMVPVYGKLSGMWVPKEVLGQLEGFDQSMQNDLTKIYLKGLSMWKEGKTVLNPVAHANNVLSNLSMAHFAGVSYWDTHKYVGAIADLVKGEDMVQEASDAGLFGGTFNRAELLKVLPEELKAMAQMTESAVGRNVDRLWNALSLFLRKPMGAAYDAEDQFFRYLIYREARNRGLDVDDAVDYAQKFIFTYDDLPKTARIIRDLPVGLPFFSYTYKVVPILAQTALEHPLRYAAPAAAIYAANQIMYAIAASLGGGDDEDWWTVIRRYMTDEEFRNKTKEMEKQERQFLPEWMKGASLSLGTEKTIRLGMDDLTNLPVFLDVSRIFPGGDLFDAHNNAGGVPLLAPLTPNNPILTTAAAMLFNKDTFRNKDIVLKTDTDAEAAQKRLAWTWKQVSPAIAVGNTHFERAMNVIANSTGQPVNVGLAEYTGIGADGLPIQAKYAAMQTVGIKARPIDLDTSEKIQASQTKAMIRDLDTQMRKLKRLEGKGAITPETSEREREKLRQKKQFLKEGLTVEGEEKD